MIDETRARGLMEGIGVGNLLGITVESWPRWRIAEAHPEGVREIHASTGYPDDDDLAQSIVIAEAALNGSLDIDDLARRFWDWGEENGLGIGGLTHRVLALYGGSDPQCLARRRRSPRKARQPEGFPAVDASKRAWAGRQAGNGALMRCAPLALRWADDPMRLVRESVISAVPTHWDRRCGWSCAVANLAAAAALRGEERSGGELLTLAEQGVAQVLSELERYGYESKPPRSLVDAVKTAERSNLSDIRFDGNDMGFTLLTLQAALISWWRATDFESGIREVIEAGGDTDTNGAVVGALLGARFGLAGIPDRWRATVDEIRAGRIPMAEYADALLKAANYATPSGS